LVTQSKAINAVNLDAALAIAVRIANSAIAAVTWHTTIGDGNRSLWQHRFSLSFTHNRLWRMLLRLSLAVTIAEPPKSTAVLAIAEHALFKIKFMVCRFAALRQTSGICPLEKHVSDYFCQTAGQLTKLPNAR
jgi:hypothetical protein